MFNYVVDKATGFFLYGGPFAPSYDEATQMVVTLGAHPDVEKVKYVTGSIVPMSAAEQKAYQLKFGVADQKGFENSMKGLFNDPLALNALLRKYPLFLWSLRDRNWPWVEALLKAALAAGDISQQFYDAVKAYADAKNVPLNL